MFAVTERSNLLVLRVVAKYFSFGYAICTIVSCPFFIPRAVSRTVRVPAAVSPTSRVVLFPTSETRDHTVFADETYYVRPTAYRFAFAARARGRKQRRRNFGGPEGETADRMKHTVACTGSTHVRMFAYVSNGAECRGETGGARPRAL